MTLAGLRGLCVHCYVDPEIRDRTAIQALLEEESRPKKGKRKPKKSEKPLPPPTDVPPGPDRVEVLAARAKSGYALWHPLDASGDVRFG